MKTRNSVLNFVNPHIFDDDGLIERNSEVKFLHAYMVLQKISLAFDLRPSNIEKVTHMMMTAISRMTVNVMINALCAEHISLPAVQKLFNFLCHLIFKRVAILKQLCHRFELKW